MNKIKKTFSVIRYIWIVLAVLLSLVFLMFILTLIQQNHSSDSKWYTSSYHNAHYYYHENCEGWQNLSSDYLKIFNSEKELLSRYNRALHPDCEEYIKNMQIMHIESHPSYDFCLSESIKATNEALIEYGYLEQDNGSWMDKDGNYPSFEHDNEISELLNNVFFNCLEK